MAIIAGTCREILENTEFVAITTNGGDEPHLVATWGDYIRTMGIQDDTLIIPAGAYSQTEENLRADKRIQLLAATHKVQGQHGPGQGCLITGTAEVVTSGDVVDQVKAKFPWARGVLVIHVDDARMQL